MEFDVAANVNGVVITSSPGFTPAASNAVCNAVVPELVAIECFVSTNFENYFWNWSTFGP